MKTCSLVFLSIVALVCTANSRSAGDEPALKSTKPLCLLTGPASAVRKTTYRRVASAAEWKSTYYDHLGKNAQQAFETLVRVPEIDFDRCTVVAVFQGAGINSRGIEVASVAETDDAVTVRYDEWHYQSGVGGGDPSAAYGFIVLPKTAKPILVEENVQGLKDAPAKWKLRARFDGEKRIGGEKDGGSSAVGE